MDASAGAARNGIRILILGADLAAVEPVVGLLESWGAEPVVLFDVPSALNALARARPYLVVLDSRFGADLAGLLAALQGDRALPADARRPVPTVVLSGPNGPPLAEVLGPDLARRVSTVRRDQPIAVEAVLREALQLAGLSSYAPLAFGPPTPAAMVGARPPAPASPRPVPAVPAGARPASLRRVPWGRVALVGAFLGLVALFAVPGYLLTSRLATRRAPGDLPPLATAAPPGQAGATGLAVPTAVTGGAPTAAPGQPGQPVPTAQTAQPGQPAPPAGSPLDPLIGLLGPLLGAQPAPPVPVAPGASGAQPGAGVAPGAAIPPGVIAPGARPPWQPPQVARTTFCGAVERWRALVRDTLAEAWNEGRLDGPAGALDDDLVLAFVLRESTGDPNAINTGGEGEIGLMQLLPTTFAEQLARPTGEALSSLTQAMQDPRLNLRAGVRYLARAFASQDGDLYWSLVAYRTGLEGAAAWRRAGGTPPETDARVRATLETYARHRPDIRLVYIPSPGAPAPAAVRPVLPPGSC